MVRATLEGIAFALIYGIEILKGDGAVIESLKVGNDNLFLSNEFSKILVLTTKDDPVIFLQSLQ